MRALLNVRRQQVLKVYAVEVVCAPAGVLLCSHTAQQIVLLCCGWNGAGSLLEAERWPCCAWHTNDSHGSVHLLPGSQPGTVELHSCGRCGSVDCENSTPHPLQWEQGHSGCLCSLPAQIGHPGIVCPNENVRVYSWSTVWLRKQQQLPTKSLSSSGQLRAAQGTCKCTHGCRSGRQGQTECMCSTGQQHPSSPGSRRRAE